MSRRSTPRHTTPHHTMAWHTPCHATPRRPRPNAFLPFHVPFRSILRFGERNFETRERERERERDWILEEADTIFRIDTLSLAFRSMSSKRCRRILGSGGRETRSEAVDVSRYTAYGVAAWRCEAVGSRSRGRVIYSWG